MVKTVCKHSQVYDCCKRYIPSKWQKALSHVLAKNTKNKTKCSEWFAYLPSSNRWYQITAWWQRRMRVTVWALRNNMKTVRHHVNISRTNIHLKSATYIRIKSVMNGRNNCQKILQTEWHHSRSPDVQVVQKSKPLSPIVIKSYYNPPLRL